MTNKQHKAMWREIAEAYYGLNYTGFPFMCHRLDDYNLHDFADRAFSQPENWTDQRQDYFYDDNICPRLPMCEVFPRGDLAYLFSTMSKTEFETLVEVEYP